MFFFPFTPLKQKFRVSHMCTYIHLFFLQVYSRVITKGSVTEIYIRVGGMYCRLLQSLHYFLLSWGPKVIRRNVGAQSDPPKRRYLSNI